MRASRCCLLLSLLAACAPPRGEAPGTGRPGTPPSASARAAWFEDVSVAAGVEFRHLRAVTTRYWLPEIMSGGACFLDFDGDRLLDLYLVQAAPLEAGESRPLASALYRNLGQGRFEDVSAGAGVRADGFGMGCTVGDADGDGDPDLFVSHLGESCYYRNDGQGRFKDATAEAGLAVSGWASSAAFFDADGDRDLDLFVARYVNWSRSREARCMAGATPDYCSPRRYNAPSPSLLFSNRGDGSFEDQSLVSGIASARGNGLGVAVADFDRDRRPDVFVANDGTPNHLWLNRGGLRFEEQALVLGSAVNLSGAVQAGMGIALGDLGGRGALDILVTNMAGETNTLFIDQGPGLGFLEQTSQAGLAASSLAMTGFGTVFADFDNDGELDLFVANGRVTRSGPVLDPADPYAESDQLYRGQAGGRFEELTPLPVAGPPGARDGSGRAVAYADWDDDGGVDLCVVDNGGQARMLRNVVSGRGNWIQLRVRDARGFDAVGAQVFATARGKTRMRPVALASSYLAAHDPRLHFGLGAATSVDEVRVLWPWGGEERFGPLEAGKEHEIREGRGQAIARAPRP